MFFVRAKPASGLAVPGLRYTLKTANEMRARGLEGKGLVAAPGHRGECWVLPREIN